ncbi:MAG: SDR family oxidoreductase [Flavobacteriales bacterium]|nr:SDR family oxidoreductase [Flavobacteriales bacterium]MCX7650253.1 SDR family oxidoreductase [Flavobacteriales bacterium]MDW8431179.1 SDR family oxidoreductase [Flavobacteriales bacterium]
MFIDLKGKTALVCGAGDGIGKAICEAFQKAGAQVIGLSRTLEKMDASLCFRRIQADMLDTQELDRKVTKLLEESGPVHILVHNTGGPAPGALLEATEEALLNAFRQHVLSAQTLARRLLPGMAAAGYGRVIHIISTSVKAPLPGLAVSNVIRGAMASWSKTLSNEWASHGITVNNILPGATLTPRLLDIIQRKALASGRPEEEVRAAMLHEIPVRRFADPQEPAALAVFLASPWAGYITGVSIPVDGGRTPCL